MDLAEGVWKLGFTRGFGEKFLKRRVAARDGKAVLRAITSVKKSLGLAAGAEVQSGYEAGRDGFWLHRFLIGHGIKNLVMDSSSLEVNRRRRRAKTDDLDRPGCWISWCGTGLEVRGNRFVLCAPPQSRKRIGVIYIGTSVREARASTHHEPDEGIVGQSRGDDRSGPRGRGGATEPASAMGRKCSPAGSSVATP